MRGEAWRRAAAVIVGVGIGTSMGLLGWPATRAATSEPSIPAAVASRVVNSSCYTRANCPGMIRGGLQITSTGWSCTTGFAARDVRSGGHKKGGRAGDLNNVAGTCHQPPVGADRHQPPDQRAPEDRSGRCRPHCKTCQLGAERRHQKREQMRDQSDLSEQPQRHSRRQRQESKIAPQPRTRQRLCGR